MTEHSIHNMKFNSCKLVRFLSFTITYAFTINQNKFLCASNYIEILTNMHIHAIPFPMDKYFDINIFDTLYLFDSETSHLIKTNPDCQNKILYMVHYDMIYLYICLLRFIIVHVLNLVSTYHLANPYQFMRKLYSWVIYYYSNYYGINGYTICTNRIDGNNYGRLILLIYYVFLPFYHSLHVSALLYCCYHNIYEIPYFVLENLAFISTIIKQTNIIIIMILLSFDYFDLKYRILCYKLCGIFSAFFSVIITNYYEYESVLFKEISLLIRNNVKIFSICEHYNWMEPIQEKQHYPKCNMGYSSKILIIRIYKQIRICFIYWSMIIIYNMRRQTSSKNYCAPGNNNCLYFYRYILYNLFSIPVHIKRHILVKVYCSYICAMFMHYCKGFIIIRVGVDYFIFLLTFSDIT